MTVYTRPARTGRPDPEAGGRSRPVPWQQMLWVTWRQHRGLLISVGVVFVVMAAAMLAEGLRIRRDYGALRSCRPVTSGTCQGMSDYFNRTDWHAAQGAHLAVLAAPVLLALFAGPPVVARELENGTFRYAWTQGIGRVRWAAAKLTVLGTVLSVAALVIGQEFGWLFGPFLTTQNMTDLSVGVFDTGTVTYAAWTLTAFCLGAFLGALARKVLTAMAATLCAFAALAALTLFYLRNHYPVGTYWPMQLFEGGWLLALCALLVTGTIWLVRRHAA